MTAVLEVTQHLTIREARRNQFSFFLKQRDTPTAVFDLTSYAGECQLRESYADFAGLVAGATVQVIDTVTGEISVDFSSGSSSFTTPARGNWDLKITNGADVQQAASGTWSIKRNVTP